VDLQEGALVPFAPSFPCRVTLQKQQGTMVLFERNLIGDPIGNWVSG